MPRWCQDPIVTATGSPAARLEEILGAELGGLDPGHRLAQVLADAGQDVGVPREGAVAMAASLVACAGVLWGAGRVGRAEGGLLVVVATGLLVWLYRRSPVFLAHEGEDADASASRLRTGAGLLLGLAAMVLGAELVVRGVRGLLATLAVSETFLGMTVVGMGESVEEVARMVIPARRGHPELAWGTSWGLW